MLDREIPARRIRARRQRRRRPGRHTAQRRGGPGARHRREQLSPCNRPRPAAQRRPAAHRRVAQDPRRAHPLPHPRCRRQHQPPEREREADRRGAVQPPGHDLERDDHDHRATRYAAIPPRRDLHRLRRLQRTARTAHLPHARTMAMQLDRAADRAARSFAARAAGRPGLFDRGLPRPPALDAKRTLDDTRTASILGHSNRSTTRRPSGKDQPPRRLFVVGITPMLRPPAPTYSTRTSAAPSRTSATRAQASGFTPSPQHRTGFQSPPLDPPSCHLQPSGSLLPAATPLRRRDHPRGEREERDERRELAIEDGHRPAARAMPSRRVSEREGIGPTETAR